MKKTLLRSAAIAALGAGIFVAAGPALYAADEKPTDISKLPLRKELMADIQASQDADKKGDAATALAKAKEADAMPNKNALEAFDAGLTLGNLALKANDYATAAPAYAEVVDSGGGTDAQRPALIDAATQLAYVTHNYEAAVRYGAMLGDGASEKTKTMLADAYLQLKDNANAAKMAQSIVDAQKAAGKTPDPEILSIMLNANVASGNQAGATAAVDQLADVSTNPQVWRMVTAQVLGGGYNLSNHQVINLLRLRLVTGSMDETDYVALAATDIQVGLPQEAKDALQIGIDKGQIANSGRVAELMQQATAAIPADQKALPQLQKIADAAKTGDPDVQYGESLYSYGRNDEAIAALQRGIMKGGLKDPADAELTLGVVLFKAGKKDEALQAFDAAGASKGNGPVAHIWSKWAARKA